MSIRLTVQFNLQEGKASEFEAAAGAAASKVRAEDEGCEMYDLFKSVDDDTRYVLVEAWATKEDLDAHGSSPAWLRCRRSAGFWRAGRRCTATRTDPGGALA